jgi:hypothetical protein
VITKSQGERFLCLIAPKGLFYHSLNRDGGVIWNGVLFGLDGDAIRFPTIEPEDRISPADAGAAVGAFEPHYVGARQRTWAALQN